MFVGERLADLRKDNNMKQEELARELGVSRSKLSTYERGKHIPSDELKIKIAVLFDVSLDYLMGLIDIEISFNRCNSVDLPRGFPKDSIPKVQEYIRLLANDSKFSHSL